MVILPALLLIAALAAVLALETDRKDVPVHVGVNCPSLLERAAPITSNLIAVDQTVHSFGDAEDMLCFDLPEPALPDGWRVTQVAVYGEAKSLAELEESGLAYVLVGVELVSESHDLALHIFEESGSRLFDVVEPVDTSLYGPGIDVRIDREHGVLRYNDRGAFLMTWSEGDFQFYATGRREGFLQSLPVLEAIE